MPQSLMNPNFAMIPSQDHPMSFFGQRHGLKTTFDSGYLVPIFLKEVLPGDVFYLSEQLFLRTCSPWVSPIMDNLFCETFYFFCPNRIVWTNWVKQCGERVNPTDSIDYSIPQRVSATSGGFTSLSLADYLGLPVGVAGISVSDIPFRIYYRVWNEYFRDENLQTSQSYGLSVGDSPVLNNNGNTPLKRGKRFDYFTACLTQPQKGDEALLPWAGPLQVYGDGYALTFSDGTYPAGNLYGTYYETNVGYSSINVDTGALNVANGTSVTPAATPANFDAIGLTTEAEVAASGTVSHAYADVPAGTSSTINDLRQAIGIQRLLELDARGGTRYREILKSFFGVTSPDQRLQRPEYLGGSRFPIMTKTIDYTAEGGGGELPGTMTARSFSFHDGNGFQKGFTEHGYVIGLINVRADLTYYQGIERHWSRLERYDFYWDPLAILGEQAVLNKEIYCQGTAGGTADEGIFGYIPRFDEYRFSHNKITGLFRGGVAGSLNSYHFSEHFSALPTLNATFIQDSSDVQVDRCISVPAQPQWILDANFDFKAKRPIPAFGVPGLTRRL